MLLRPGATRVIANRFRHAAEMCGVRSVPETLAAYQLPFIYVHMLAFMVHFVRICCWSAVSPFGSDWFFREVV